MGMITAAFVMMGAFFAIGLYVAGALGVLSLLLMYFYSDAPLWNIMGNKAWETNTNFILVAVPLFLLMGELMLRSGMGERMYNSLSRWMGFLPGGLMHTNIASCAIFAACAGSSAATAATISRVSLPAFRQRGYDERLVVGSLAAGGTLGILIPPSIGFILYGVLMNESVGRLYLAGFIPGFMLASMMMLMIAGAALVFPSIAPREALASWRDRITGLLTLIPIAFIIFMVLGSIYMGLATPTEAASLGVVASLALAAFARSLSIEMLRRAVEGTMRTTAMVMLIILAAIFLNFVLAAIGLTQALSQFVLELGLTPMQTLLAVIAFYLVLGCFMETLSMLLTTTPLIVPIIVSLGFDPVWFGILMMVMLETALITPPIGVNLYVVQGVRGRGSMNDVITGTLPFVATMFVMIALLVLFPGLALWLPELFY